MYKRIYDSEEIVVDYYDDGKPMVRVSQFEDGHFRDEHFVEIPTAEVVHCRDCTVPHNRWTGCPRMNGTIMPEDGYCSFGERRKD
jgi:hypothetical protein